MNATKLNASPTPTLPGREGGKANPKITHIQSRRDAAERCMRRVKWLLHWSDERYCWYKYEAGLEYLRIYLKGDVEIINAVERTKSFWGWWKLHWTIREEEWLQGLEKLQNIAVGIRMKDYRALHNAASLAAEMNGASRQLGDSYGNMIYAALREYEELKTTTA